VTTYLRAYRRAAAAIIRQTTIKAANPIPLAPHVEAMLTTLQTTAELSPETKRLASDVEAYLALAAMNAGDEALQALPVAGAKTLFQIPIEATIWAREHTAALVTKINETTRQEIVSIVQRGLLLGLSNDQLAASLREQFAFSSVRAEMIARTETQFAVQNGNLIAYKASGIVSKKRWLTAKFDVCPICVALDGTVVSIDEGFSGAAGAQCPPAHPRCRCDLLPVIDETDVAPPPPPSPPKAPEAPKVVKPPAPKVKALGSSQGAWSPASIGPKPGPDAPHGEKIAWGMKWKKLTPAQQGQWEQVYSVGAGVPKLPQPPPFKPAPATGGVTNLGGKSIWGNIWNPEPWPNVQPVVKPEASWKWRQQLPAHERGALGDYQASHYTKINALAQGRYERLDADDIVRRADQMRGLDNAIAAALPLEKDLYVYRGVQGSTASTLTEEAKSLVGKTKQFNSYGSTSIDSKVAKGFSGGDRVVMRIRIPKGTRAPYMTSYTGPSFYEGEVLLGRGYQVEVKAVYKSNKVTYFDCDLVGFNPPSIDSLVAGSKGKTK
jgi:SPP1 gp7 family putative phage head morphogenesis protein